MLAAPLSWMNLHCVAVEDFLPSTPWVQGFKTMVGICSNCFMTQAWNYSLLTIIMPQIFWAKSTRAFMNRWFMKWYSCSDCYSRLPIGQWLGWSWVESSLWPYIHCPRKYREGRPFFVLIKGQRFQMNLGRCGLSVGGWVNDFFVLCFYFLSWEANNNSLIRWLL